MRNSHIQPTVLIHIQHRHTALITLGVNSGFRGPNRTKFSRADAAQPKATPIVVATNRADTLSPILGQQQILSPVSVKIGHADGEHWRLLSLARQGSPLKAPSAIQKNGRL